MATGVQDSDGFPGSLATKGSPTTSDLVKIADEAASGVAKQTTIGDLPFVQLAGGTMTGLLILSGDPSNALGAVTKQYADAISAGLDVKQPVLAASTTALTVTYNNGVSGVGATLTNAGAQAAITLDGQSPTVGQRVLIKNQASAFQNGIYSVTVVGTGATNWVLTRTTDYDLAPSQIFPGNLVIITAGTVNADTSWLQTATVNTIGTDSISFIQFTTTPLTLPLGVTSGGTGLGSTTANQLLYSSATSTIAGLATANSSVLATNGSGVPALTTALPSGITATTQSVNDASTKVATTAYVNNAVNYSQSNVTASSNTTYTQAISTAQYFKITFSSSCTLAFTFDSSLVESMCLQLINAGAYTVTWTSVKWAGGSAPTFTSSGTDMVVIWQNGDGNIYGALIGLAFA